MGTLHPPRAKEQAMQSVEAVVSSEGQVTLPAAMRAKLGIKPGSHIHFELRLSCARASW